MIVKRRIAVSMLVALASMALIAESAGASVSATAEPTDSVDGIVYALVQVGDRTIIGGDFNAVGGQPRSNVAAIRSDGTVDPSFAPTPNGVVQSLAVSADGSTVYVGGTFSEVGGVPRQNLAAVDAGSGATSPWQVDTDGDVLSMATSGTSLYVAGRFRDIGGERRQRLARVDQDTGAVDVSFHPWPNWTVKEINVSPDGTKVYAVGGFTSIGGQARRGAGEVLAGTGRATGFDPSVGGVALASGLTPDGSRFFFSTTDNHVYAYDPAISNDPVFAVKSSGDTQAIAVSATEAYLGGHFGQLWLEDDGSTQTKGKGGKSSSKIKRSLIGSISITDGAITDWNPGASGRMGPWAAIVTSDQVVMGGELTRAGGQRTEGIARFSGQP